MLGSIILVIEKLSKAVFPKKPTLMKKKRKILETLTTTKLTPFMDIVRALFFQVIIILLSIIETSNNNGQFTYMGNT